MIAPQLRYRMSTALALAAFVLALPAAAADFQLDNIKLDFGTMEITAPKLLVKGSTLEREAFASLLNAQTGESAVARVNRLNATELTAPELVFTYQRGQQKQVTTYRDVRFSDIRDGQIARGESSGGTIVGQTPEVGTMTGTMKRIGFEGADLGHAARVFTDRAQPGVSEPMRPLIRRVEQDGHSIDMGAMGTMSFGKAVGRNFAAKVGPEPLGDIVSRMMAMQEAVQAKGDKADKDDPAQRAAEKQVGLSVLSLFERIDSGSGEIRDMTMNVTNPTSPTRSGPVAIKIGRIAYGEDAPVKSGFALEGLQFAGGGAKGLIDSISYSGFSFSPMLKALQDDLAKPETDAASIDWRRYIPTIGTIRLAGLSVDAPPMLPSGQPIKIGLGTFELKAGEQLNGIPTSLSLTIDKLVAPITEGTGNPAARDMIAMGIRSLDLSAKLDLAWEAARNELAIRQISFGGAGLARLEASATLGNVTRDLFSSDVALAQVAALGATARGLTAKLENFGLVEKLIANEARKAGRKPEEMRQQFAMIASIGLASILGPSDAAKALTAAISRFAAKPGTLTIEASARTAGGLGLADVIAITDPTEILDKIDLKASAQ